MDDVKLANWLAGLEPGPIEVGLLGAELLAALALPAGLSLLLSDYTLTKIRFGHPEIDLRDYQRLPDILLLGCAYRGRRKRSLEIVGMGSDEIEGVAYRACIKATAKNEVYLVTFHRVDWKEARRLYRRASKVGGIVREPKGKLAQRLSRRAS